MSFARYDSLTGVPSCQRTVAFEKASVLFNIGGLYTQIGTRQDRGTEQVNTNLKSLLFSALLCSALLFSALLTLMELTETMTRGRQD